MGRFVSTDPYQGRMHEPVTLHKYLYANANPDMLCDPSGNFGIATYAAWSVAWISLVGVISLGNMNLLFNDKRPIFWKGKMLMFGGGRGVIGVDLITFYFRSESIYDSGRKVYTSVNAILGGFSFATPSIVLYDVTFETPGKYRIFRNEGISRAFYGVASFLSASFTSGPA